uniref:Uncharacterized protein n=1 Tax=Pygocentrus nattereri TaxID=42514 RepID=A0AAR2LWH3_PYGNA
YSEHLQTITSSTPTIPSLPYPSLSLLSSGVRSSKDLATSSPRKASWSYSKFSASLCSLLLSGASWCTRSFFSVGLGSPGPTPGARPGGSVPRRASGLSPKRSMLA